MLAQDAPTKADLDAAIKAQQKIIDDITRRDRGGGADHYDDIRMSRAVTELGRLRDLQYGVVRAEAYVPPKRGRPRKKLPRSVTRNLCKCDLGRWKDEMAPGAFTASGQLTANASPVRPPRMPLARCIAELCAGCHLPKLFAHAARWGKSPAEYVKAWHGFEPTDDEREYLNRAFSLYPNK